MIEKVKQLLLAGINGEALVGEISAHFFESVEDNRKEGSQLYGRMLLFPTLQDFFSMDPEGLGYDDILLLDDLLGDIEYALQFRFDQIEDSVKKELIEGKYAEEVKKEVRSGIVPISLLELNRENGGALSEDEVEEYYMDAFMEFDDLRNAIYQGILRSNPAEFFEQGRKEIEAEKDTNHLLMDERDFVQAFKDHLDKERLHQLFARGIYEAIHFHSRYQLELIDMSDMPKDPDEEPAEEERYGYMSDEDMDKVLSVPEASEGVLEPIGDLDPADYTFVYELLAEYTGHRILPSDDENVTEAYWSTYGDDLGDMLGMYMINALEDTVRDLNEKEPIRYDSLARYYHWNMDQRKDPETILSTCDKISYALTDLQEKLWMDFTEDYLMPYYQEGEQMANERNSKE